MSLDIKALFPNETYTEAEIYEIAETNGLQVDITNLATFSIIEVVECFHEMTDVRMAFPKGRLSDCDLSDNDHETLAEFRNDLADGKRFYLDE